jgi:hypothetical protein
VSARVGVALCGAIALLVLARTAAYYARTDALALVLVLAMTVALVAALAELLARVTRASRLASELSAFPRPATQAAIDASSEPLRSLLRARLTNASGTPGAAPLAGYVVGLLVMLGLLGTFLGLFETLRGAREALTSSGDVETLRAGLTAPMMGLTRSFGTSAAGVSASAMLGLAAALTRRAESRFAQAFASYAAEGLAPMTMQGRQLAALEHVAAQGEALPRMVSALETAVARLAALEGSWTSAHAEAATRTASTIGEAVERAGGEMQRAVVQTVKAAEGVLSPLVARAVEGAVAAAKVHVVEMGAHFDADRKARREEDATRAQAYAEAFARITAAEEKRDTGLTARWADATTSFETAVQAAEVRGASRDEAFARVAAHLAATSERAIASANERLAQADARAAEHASTLGRLFDAVAAERAAAALAGKEEREAVNAFFAGWAARAEALDERLRQAHTSLVDEVRRGLADHAAQAVTLERTAGAALTVQAERLAESLARDASERERQLEAVATSVREAAAEMQGGGAELSGVAVMFAGAVDRHRAGAAEWLAALGTLEGAIARAANETAARALDEQLGRARELFDAQLQFHRELLLQLRGVHVAAAADAIRGRRDERDEDVPA